MPSDNCHIDEVFPKRLFSFSMLKRLTTVVPVPVYTSVYRRVYIRVIHTYTRRYTREFLWTKLLSD